MKYLIRSISQFHKLILMIADLIFFLLAVQVAHFARLGEFSGLWYSRPLFGVIVLFVLSCLYIFGAYDFSDKVRLPGLLTRIVIALVIGLVGSVFLTFLFGEAHFGVFGRGILTGSMLLFFIPCSALRVGFFFVYNHYRSALPWLFVVSANGLSQLRNDVKSHSFKGKISFLSEDQLETANLDTYFQDSDTVVVLANDSMPPSFAARLMDERLSGRTILDVCTFYEIYWKTVPLVFLKNKWFVLTNGFVLVDHPVELRLKRFLDLSLALVLLVLSWPLMLLTMIAVRLEAPEVFYHQTRVGKNGRPFTIYKFRSMIMNAEKNGAQWATVNDTRITKVGKFIRLTRLDELPQIFNIIRGDMSFVGPRPERPEFNREIEQAVPFYNVRHLVRPGLTGWAQILYPYGASLDDARQKLQFEIYYIKNYSLLLDVVIVLKTISVVLLGKGR